MFKRALLVLEPARPADAFAKAALAMARPGLAEVVFYTPAQRSAPNPAQPPLDPCHAQARCEAEAQGVLSRSVPAPKGELADSIVNAARLARCDVIMAASDAGNAVVRLINGSFVPGLVTASPLPVLLWPSHAPPGASGKTSNGPLLVILDHGEPLETTCARALQLARERAASLHFVHITPSCIGPVVDGGGLVMDMDTRLLTEMLSQSRRLVDAACTRAAMAGVTAHGTCMAPGTTARDIARMAAEQACSLIIVGHRGRHAVLRLLSGHLIPGLITTASTPVLIVRQAEQTPQPRVARRRAHRRKAGPVAKSAPSLPAPMR